MARLPHHREIGSGWRGGRTTPPRAVSKRGLGPLVGATPISGAEKSSIDFGGDEHYAYGRLPPLAGYTHASITIGDGHGAALSPNRFEFWVTEVGFGYGSSGTEAQSKFYNAYYSKTFTLTPISIKGRVPTERYLADMQDWVRASQVNIASGEPRLWLSINAANVAVWGYVNSFAGGQVTGFAPAPEISFNFTITRERKKYSSGGELSQQIVAYFLDPQDKYWSKKATVFIGAETDALTQDVEAQLRAKVLRDARRAPGAFL